MLLPGGRKGPFHSGHHSISNLNISELNISDLDFLLHFVRSHSQTAVFYKETHMLMTVQRSVTKILSTSVGWRYIAMESY